MNILIATHHLLDFAGTEVYTLTLAKYLVRLGHKVTVYSKYVDKLKDPIIDVGADIVNNLEVIKDQKFDVAHVHHNITCYTVRHIFPKIPIVLVIHGVKPFLEQLPYGDIGISKYVAISDGIRKKVQKEIGNKSKVFLVRNLIDEDLFTPKSQISDKPKKAIVLSSKISEKNENILTTALHKLNIEYKIYGKNHEYISYEKIAHKINDADLVITIGRGVPEALMCKRMVLAYDNQGGDGIVTRENYSRLRTNSFNGTTNAISHDSDQIKNEIKYNYSKNDLDFLNKKAILDYSALSNTKKMLEIYNETVLAKSISHVSSEMLFHLENIINESYHYSRKQALYDNEKSSIKAEIRSYIYKLKNFLSV